MEFVSHGPRDTERLAIRLAPLLRQGDVVLLDGDLGAGKSLLCRAIIRTLAGDPGLEVPSPTFTLVQTYDIQENSIWHYDLYRIRDPEELWELGWEEALAGGIVLVEWPDRLGPARPARHLAIHIRATGSSGEDRSITIEQHGTWPAALGKIAA